jgi:hypothetical protein
VSRTPSLRRMWTKTSGTRTGARPGGATIGACRSISPTAELATAAQACRAMAYQEGERARKMENPDMRQPIEATARRYSVLAEKLEAARRSGG